ncbi:MAG: hypothetical protein LUD02_13750 [Tannerellaceae bacterium]|nr:hypothetical protein [Tannerellaceae bacterium]
MKNEKVTLEELQKEVSEETAKELNLEELSEVEGGDGIQPACSWGCGIGHLEADR